MKEEEALLAEIGGAETDLLKVKDKDLGAKDLIIMVLNQGSGKEGITGIERIDFFIIFIFLILLLYIVQAH